MICDSELLWVQSHFYVPTKSIPVSREGAEFQISSVLLSQRSHKVFCKFSVAILAGKFLLSPQRGDYSMNLPTEQGALKSSWENNLLFNIKKRRKCPGNKKGIKITHPTPSHMREKIPKNKNPGSRAVVLTGNHSTAPNPASVISKNLLHWIPWKLWLEKYCY